MPRVNQHSQEGVNPQEPPRPGYYAIIPAAVRYCKSLPPSAKLLFGEIVALTSVRGHCYAQNPYFEELYGVDRSTVKRWLAALQAEGFIAVQYDQATNERRIYANAMLAGVAQKQATPGAKTGHPWRKNAPQSTTEIIKSSTTPLNVAGVGGQPPSEQGEAVSASRKQWIDQRVAEVVRLAADEGSERRFKQLLGASDEGGRSDLWEAAVMALKSALASPTGPPERPGAYFQAILVRSLHEAGIMVSSGSRQEREQIRRTIAQSFSEVQS